MSTLELALRRVAQLLSDAGVPFALVGGLAVSVRVEPRFTRDADLAVSVASDAEAESVTARLVGAGCRVVATVEQIATGRLATVRLVVGATADAPVVDLLFASSGIEDQSKYDNREAKAYSSTKAKAAPFAVFGSTPSMRNRKRGDASTATMACEIPSSKVLSGCL